jgi:CRP/FNR family cyclic AMP-dependent transcriptional regulator
LGEQQLFERFGCIYPAGTVLFREGDPGREMYVLQTGEVEISRHMGDEDTVIAVLRAGEFLGEMAIVNNRPRSATATVKRESRMLVIDSRTFEAMLRGKTEIAVRMIRTLAARLERANQQIELLLLRDVNHRVAQCLRQMADEQEHSIGPARFVPITLGQLAARAALREDEVAEVVDRLVRAQLVAPVSGVEPGYAIPEPGRLIEFLEFLELKQRVDTKTDL